MSKQFDKSNALDHIVVVLPSRLPLSERGPMVDGLVRRVLAQRPHQHATDAELFDRAAALSRRYLLGTLPRSIRWVSNQQRRWGSCSAHSGMGLLRSLPMTPSKFLPSRGS